jgi:DNA mismatch repair protein MutS2
MLLPSGIESKLGFDKIRIHLQERCKGAVGIEFLNKVRFSSDFSYLSRLHDQTAEAISMLREGSSFPSSAYEDIQPYVKRAEIEGSFLTEEELHQLSQALLLLQATISFIAKRKNELPHLWALCENLHIPDEVLKEINRCIDVNGQMKGNASPALAKLRSDKQSTQLRVRRVLDNVLKESAAKGYLPDDASPTLRAGRMVIPVLAEHKRHVKGFIHDESASGQTVFMEPAAVLELNNDLRDLELRERKEIIRILSMLTSMVRPHAEQLKQARTTLGLLDFIHAKALWALHIDGVCPRLQNQPGLRWKNAIHPLLLISHRGMGKPVVPQDVELNHDQRILIISGPNAGGKSVSLKTIGLLQYMIQCGTPVPVSDDAEAGVFRQMFLDIGDEQSIENDLSTYSSHLSSMKAFLFHADKRTLVLIDEFGTGTEPDFGGAIAEAVLEGLHKKRVFGVITTHYANLKELANKTPGMQNAAMQFDLEHLEPLYKLQIGKPGSSFALEIAGKIGLDQEVIQAARKKIGKERVRLDKALVDLEREKARLEKLNKQREEEQKKLKESSEEYQSLKSYLDVEKKNILKQAKTEAAELLQEANKKIEATIRQIKEVKGEKEATKAIRKELENFKENIRPTKKVKTKSPPLTLASGPIEPGDMVSIDDTGAIAKVLSIKGKQAEVLIGELNSKVKLDRLRKVGKVQEEKSLKSSGKRNTINVVETSMNFSPSLDTRGMRGEEVLPVLQNFLDKALLLSQKDLSIVHGKGDGILRELIRQELRKWQEVHHIRDEHADRGGAGVTLFELR